MGLSQQSEGALFQTMHQSCGMQMLIQQESGLKLTSKGPQRTEQQYHLLVSAWTKTRACDNAPAASCAGNDCLEPASR